MTTIRIMRDKDHVRISIHGHAGFNPGNDPVCAGVSMVCYMLLCTLAKYDQGGIITGLAAEAIDGNVTADFSVKHDDIWNNAWLIFREGFEGLCNQYPDHVKWEL